MYYRQNRSVIPATDCVPGYLYRIDTRNLGPVAVFGGKDNGFFGIRRKFGELFLDIEYHYDNGPPFGTANPWEELPEELLRGIELRTHGDTVCFNCRVLVVWRSNTDGTPLGPPPGIWDHLAPTECTDVRPVGFQNTPLFEWLKHMEEKYLGPKGWVPEWQK